MLAKIRKYIINFRFVFLTIALLVVNALVLYGIYTQTISQDASPALSPGVAQAQEIKGIKESTNDRQKVLLYTQLIERVGPEGAQEALYTSGLPFDGQTHLLNHTVGDWLYKNEGLGGIVKCRDYFLSSCYHGFLIQVIGKSGLDNLDEVMGKCWEVGVPTATQCAHGIGHGLLAFEGYKNLPKALSDCDTVATLSEHFPLYNCHDGVFMENLWAVHEGMPSPDRWIDEADPVFPCNDSRIAEKYRKACWSNQPHVMYQLFKADIKKVAAECMKLEGSEYQPTCFDALARQLHPITNNRVPEVFRLCGQIPTPWDGQCITSIAVAYFSVGDRERPFQICAQDKKERQASCYNSLSGIINNYHKASDPQRNASCLKIPEEYRNGCMPEPMR